MTKERKNIVQRVVEWNEARFKQEFNYELELSMLTEEILELYEAKTTIERFDAIGDIIFVAIGTMWKLGIPNNVITRIFYSEDLSTLDILHLVGWSNECKSQAIDNLDHSIEAAYSGFDLAITSSLLIAVASLRGLGFQEYLYDIVEAICDSNDTKVVKKTASDTKANIDKGQTFVPPTDRLRTIANYSTRTIN